MTHPAIFNFNVQKEDSTITVERSFNAPVDTVWNAWTDPDILCQWWAPQPYQCVIKSHDFREGGQWLYCMEGPEGDCHWGVFDFETIRPNTFYSGYDAFSDDEGMADTTKPKMHWENTFREEEGRTVVKILIRCASTKDLEGIIKMGFKEGFTQGLQQLEDLLNSK
jgi:PhnB protein